MFWVTERHLGGRSHIQLSLSPRCVSRRLLEQQVEELRQQLRHSRETEASLAKMHVELQAKTLHVLEDEKKLDADEVSDSEGVPRHVRGNRTIMSWNLLLGAARIGNIRPGAEPLQIPLISTGAGGKAASHCQLVSQDAALRAQEGWVVSSFPFSCRAWSFCLEILAESIVWEGSLPLSATKSHCSLLGGGGSGLGVWLAGWLYIGCSGNHWD